MAIWHDLECSQCGAVEIDARVQGEITTCILCQGMRKIVYDRWTTVHTDLFPTPQYSDASGRMHSSQREKERYMRELGYEVCGDPKGGARPDHRIKDTAFSFSGQTSRRSTAERAHTSGRIAPGIRSGR